MNAGSDQGIEVVNAGTGGWGPFQYAEFYEHYGQAFEPDLVLVGFFVGNDSYINRHSLNDTRSAVLGRRLPRDRGETVWVKLRVLLYENLHLARAFMTPGQKRIEFTRASCEDFNDYYLGIQGERMPVHRAQPAPEDLVQLANNVDQIGRIKALAEARDVPVVTAIFPDENQVNVALQSLLVPPEEREQYDFDMPQQALHPLFAERGIEYVDLLGAVRSDARCLYMNDTHWVPAGHAFVAEQLRNYLVERGLVPAAL